MKNSDIMKKLAPWIPASVSGAIIRNKVRIKEDWANEFTFKVATEKDELEQAYKLLHDVYLQEGYSDQQRDSLRLNVHQTHPHTVTFIGKKKEKVAITMTLYPDSILGLPMEKLYGRELNRLRSKGRRLGEVGALASDPSFRRMAATLPFFINKTMFLYAEQYLGLDDLVITVNPKHQAVYEHILLFKRFGKNKSYNTVKGHPAVPLRLNVNTTRKRYKKAYAKAIGEKDLNDFFLIRDSANILLPSAKQPIRTWDNGLFDYFFRERTNLIDELDEKTRFLVISHYPKDRKAPTTHSSSIV